MNLKRYILAQIVTLAFLWTALVLAFIRSLLNNPFRNPFAVNERKIPERLNDAKYGTHKYVKANNIKLHYVESGDPSKPLMLFIHGFPEFWYSWRHQIVHFNKNYRVVAVDMRGYGDSEKPKDISSYKIDILVEDIRDLIRQLGAKKCILVSHDWGGIVCCRFRDTYPDVLDAVLLFASASIEAWFDLIWNSSNQFWKSLYVYMFRAPYVPELIMRMGDLDVFKDMMLFKGKDGVDMEDINCFQYNYSRKDAFTPGLNYYRANFNYGLTTTKHEENVPFLVAGAEKDTALSLDLHTAMKKVYTHVETMEVKGCGHFMQQEDPDKVNSIIRDFLSKHKL